MRTRQVTHHGIGEQVAAIWRHPETGDGVCVTLEGHGHRHLAQVPDLHTVLNAPGVYLIPSLRERHRQNLVLLRHGVHAALRPQVPQLQDHGARTWSDFKHWVPEGM